jgi:hypothetical protein
MSGYVSKLKKSLVSSRTRQAVILISIYTTLRISEKCSRRTNWTMTRWRDGSKRDKNRKMKPDLKKRVREINWA